MSHRSWQKQALRRCSKCPKVEIGTDGSEVERRNPCNRPMHPQRQHRRCMESSALPCTIPRGRNPMLHLSELWSCVPDVSATFCDGVQEAVAVRIPPQRMINTGCTASLKFLPGALSRRERIEFAKTDPFVDDSQRPVLAARRRPTPFVLRFPHFRRTVVDFRSSLFTRWPSREPLMAH